MKERIQKILSKKEFCSRRKAEILLREKRIHVNGNIALIGERADLENDTIKVDNQIISKKDHLFLRKNSMINRKFYLKRI